MSGNAALAEAAVLSGCTCYFGYPITPQNELTEYMAKRIVEAGGVFIQSESEIAAINMVLGASVAGARAMTSSSGPGISLKQEGISYLVADELPAVIVNIVRGGPGMGNISPAQSDYFQATRGGGHGDYRTIVLAPGSVQELTEVVPLAFDLADKYRNPVMILGDGMLGQMMEPVDFDNLKRPPDYEKDYILTGAKDRPARKIHSLIFDAKLQEEHNWKLFRKFQLMEQNEVRYETYLTDDAEMIVVAYGIGARIAKGAIKRLREESLKVGMIRPITLWPFPAKAIQDMAKTVRRLLRLRDEHRSDGRGREACARGKGQRPFLRQARRRRPHAGRALPDHLAPLLPGAGRRQEEEAMKTVYKRPKLLKEAHFHYCPGCGHGIINRLLMEVIEEMDLQEKAICVAPAGCGMLLYNYFEIDVLESAHGRGSAVATGIKRVQAGEPGLLLPGRRRPRRHRHRRRVPRRQPGREHHRDLREQRRVRHDRRPDGADDAARSGDDHHPAGARRHYRRSPHKDLRSVRPTRRHVLSRARAPSTSRRRS